MIDRAASIWPGRGVPDGRLSLWMLRVRFAMLQAIQLTAQPGNLVGLPHKRIQLLMLKENRLPLILEP